MRNRFLMIILSFFMFSSVGVGAEEQNEEFFAKQDTRLHRFISPGGRLKNGKNPVVSFIFPEGFKTNYCGEALRNSKGEVYCTETEGEFTLKKEVLDASGRKITLSILVAASRSKKEIESSKDESKNNVGMQFKVMTSAKNVDEGEFSLPSGIDGYYGTYISHAPFGKQMNRVMFHSVGKCTFFTFYSEYPYVQPPYSEKNIEPIGVENWIHGDLQKMVQNSFRCEEMSDRDFSKFK